MSKYSAKESTNFKINVSFVAPLEDPLKDLLYLILQDYCDRFKVSVLPHYKDVRINLCGYMKPSGDISGQMGCTIESNFGFMIQVRDPFLDEEEDSYVNDITVYSYLDTICHELVHLCQHLTGRKGIHLRIPYDKNDEEDCYFFDPVEVEARVLQGYYSCKYGLDTIIDKVLTIQDTDNKTQDIEL